MGILLCAGPGWSWAGEGQTFDEAQLHSIIEHMKTQPRGPFKRIRWFCKDGKVLPPGEGACHDHGGGHQHGEWNSDALALRQQGYLVANVLAAVDPLDFVGPDAHLDDLKQILMEQFVIHNDNGWVFRQARFYRGALQVEDERAAARAILLALVEDKAWQRPERFLLLREAARLLPVSEETPTATKIRQEVVDIADKDPGFMELRVKIHNLPDAQDAERVRGYAKEHGKPKLQEAYSQLAKDLDALYAPQTAIEQLKHLADESADKAFRQEMAETVRELAAARDADAAISVAAARAQAWRAALMQGDTFSAPNRLRLLQASLILEQEVYALGNRLLEHAARASRAQRLLWLRHLGAALHAAGMLSDRQWHAIDTELDQLDTGKHVSLATYYRGVHYLARVPQWSQRSLEFYFQATVQRWSMLTPFAMNYVPDRLRGSPLLAFTRVLDSLVADANQLSGIKYKLFGREIAGGLRALNPGLSRGRLLLPPAKSSEMRPDGIYILHSTTQYLPPVAGIITRGEGSSVSHVQLLARNMGIPNLVADDALLPLIRSHVGESVVMAVSQNGAVTIERDSPRWDTVFGRKPLAAPDIMINTDTAKLNLRDTRLYSLKDIRATDSGRIVGPKAGNLGELRHYFPQMVNPGVVIPFAVFRKYLDKPLYAGGPTVFTWMRSEYARIRAIGDTSQRANERRILLSRLRQWIVNSDPGDGFRRQLKAALNQVFGRDGSYGVFVRSDTNVEDLPGFNGAGLNLTLPNVVGFDAIVKAIQRVWASPFTDRAYAWRQSHMRSPEHVYPAVLLLKSFPSEKSGVMVTVDVDTGDRGWLSIATNEGVGGAVEGQAAEELRVNRETGTVRLMSQATAPLRVALAPGGGIVHLPASGREQLLSRSEIDRLRTLVRDVDARFPMPTKQDGTPMAADIEFGFSHGRLTLFQIRPFVQSHRAKRSLALMDMELPLAELQRIKVALGQSPRTTGGAP